MKKTMLCIICGFVMCLSGFANTPSLNAKLAKQIPSKQELTQEQIQLINSVLENAKKNPIFFESLARRLELPLTASQLEKRNNQVKLTSPRIDLSWAENHAAYWGRQDGSNYSWYEEGKRAILTATPKLDDKGMKELAERDWNKTFIPNFFFWYPGFSYPSYEVTRMHDKYIPAWCEGYLSNF